jgi:hypothetical protein
MHNPKYTKEEQEKIKELEQQGRLEEAQKIILRKLNE